MKKMLNVILSVAAVVALAAPAMAAGTNKLLVKDSGGSNNVFQVTDAGQVGIGGDNSGTTDKLMLNYPDASLALGDAVFTTKQNGKSRVTIQAGGSQEWIFPLDNSATAGAAGKFMYATPGGKPGLIIYTGPAADQERFNIINNSYAFRMYFQNYLGLYIYPNGISVNNFANPSAPLNIKAPAAGFVAPTFVGSKGNVKIAGTYTGTVPASYNIVIDGNGTPNTFKWNKDGGAYTTGVAITAAAQTLSDGITVQFASTTGYTLNDTWAVYSGNIANFENASGTTVMAINANGRVGIGTKTPTSNLQVVGLPTYTSNANAITGGLSAGAFYTDGTGNVKVVY